MSIRLIVGLGNPGLIYKQTRHNIGFRFVENLAHDVRFKYQARFKACLAYITINSDDIFLLEPQTYMNFSGQSVVSLMYYYKIKSEQILVVHDELNLLPGIAKIKKGGSSGGHNGLKNIITTIGTELCWRLRIGIGHPRNLGFEKSISNFVLDKPSSTEQKQIDSAFEKSLTVIPLLCSGKFEAGIQKLHSSF